MRARAVHLQLQLVLEADLHLVAAERLRAVERLVGDVDELLHPVRVLGLVRAADRDRDRELEAALRDERRALTARRQRSATSRTRAGDVSGSRTTNSSPP